ncbi:hypothetical protein HK104_004881 [Borealophlyctis nickersoniae]|nr:hypothetical protein HK104_004881 [Borealophlyctis nickersoniae]
MTVSETLKETYKSHFDFPGVRINAYPLRDHALRGIVNNVPVLFQIMTGQKSNTGVCTPFDLCIVLDVSGSMAGAPLQHCKTAIKAIINGLGPHDQIHIVTYAYDAKMVVECGSVEERQEMCEKVDAIEANGGTNTCAGLNVAHDILTTKYKNAEYRRIFLFSDGCVNVGVQNRDAIAAIVGGYAEDNIPVTSFGIGREYDELLMKRISDAGDGEYFYIDSAEHIEDLVAKGTRAITSIIARKATMHIRGIDDSVLVRIDGQTDTDLPGQTQIPVLRTRGLVQILAHFDIRPRCASIFGPSAPSHDAEDFDITHISRLAQYHLTVPASFNEHISPADRTPLHGTIPIHYTDNPTDVAPHLHNPDTQCALTIKQCSDLDKRVLELLDLGNRAEAIKVKEQVVAKYKSVRDGMGFAEALLGKAEAALESMKKSQDEVRLRKEAHYRCHEESDDDLGFGLFD